MQEQNYNNHKKYVIGYHIITFGLAFLLLILSVYNLISSLTGSNSSLQAFMFVTVTVLFLLIFFYARVFALKAQDRAIRAEENFRHYILTGKIFDHKITLPQILALRFAQDAEFIELTKRSVSEQLSPEDIKKAIQNWKGDYYRV